MTPAGDGGPSVRLLTESDLPALMALKEAAGWNQTEQIGRASCRERV